VVDWAWQIKGKNDICSKITRKRNGVKGYFHIIVIDDQTFYFQTTVLKNFPLERKSVPNCRELAG